MVELRDYQQEATDAVVEGLSAGGRGQLRAACGSGKSLMALHAARRLCPRDLVVVACHSLALVAQTLHVWAAAGVTTDVLAVCSDDTLTDTAVKVSDLPCPVTTDVTDITGWLQRTTASRLRLILVTHVSAGVLGEGLLAADAAAGLLIVDEAHRTAGVHDKHTALMHHDEHLPAARRLYLTATPRVLKGNRRGRRHAHELLSMDDRAMFGPVLYDYPFARGIAEGWLDDYRIVVIGVTSSEALRLLRSVNPDTVVEASGAPLLTAVLQAALVRAAVQFGLRRVLVFHSRIARSKEFTRTLPAAVKAMSSSDLLPGPVTAGHIDGTHSGTQRERVLANLIEPPDAGWAVVSNARCLNEGLDVPAVDGVAFAAPKDSPPDVIQSVGRALRRHPDGSGTATVLVPVLLADDPADAAADLDADKSAWATVLQVLRALRAYDGRLAADLDTQRGHAGNGDPAVLPARMLVQLPDGYATDDLLRHITVRILEETTADWIVGYTALRAFHSAHGHLRVPVDHVAAGVKLSPWMAVQRTAYRHGRLSAEQIQQLEDLGFSWAPRDETWECRYDAAQTFYAEHGHLRILPGHVANGIDLYSWLRAQRDQHRRGVLEEKKISRLEAIGIVWEPMDEAWERQFNDAQQFYAHNGHLRVPRKTAGDRTTLYEWLGAQRRHHKDGSLPDDKVRRLEDIGMAWTPRDEDWERGLAAMQQFRAQHGHLRVPSGTVVDSVNITYWMEAQRRSRENGTLPVDKVRKLEAAGLVWSPLDEAWDRGLAAAEEFLAEHGHLRVPRDDIRNGVRLNKWLVTQRHSHKKGKLSAERIQRLQNLGMIAREATA